MHGFTAKTKTDYRKIHQELPAQCNFLQSRRTDPAHTLLIRPSSPKLRATADSTGNESMGTGVSHPLEAQSKSKPIPQRSRRDVPPYDHFSSPGTEDISTNVTREAKEPSTVRMMQKQTRQRGLRLAGALAKNVRTGIPIAACIPFQMDLNWRHVGVLQCPTDISAWKLRDGSLNGTFARGVADHSTVSHATIRARCGSRPRDNSLGFPRLERTSWFVLRKVGCSNGGRKTREGVSLRATGLHRGGLRRERRRTRTR